MLGIFFFVAICGLAKSADALLMISALDGIPLNTTVHLGSHRDYDARILQRLNQIPASATTKQAYDAAQYLISDIRTAIQNNPNTHVNNLIF